MFKRALAVSAVTLMSLAIPGGAANAAPTSTTTTVHGVVETFVDVFPSCEEGAPLYEITTTRNSVSHETVFPDGRFHGTFTDTGRFVAEPLDPSLPSYTGHFTVWGNFNGNTKSASGTFTFNVSGTGSDGSKLQNHVVEHFNERPDGTVHEFFKCH